MRELVLYDADLSPAGRRVRMWLLEKKIPFRGVRLSLGLLDQKSPRYLRLNPTGVVPTLVDAGVALYDSHVILEYLETLAPSPPLVPADPGGQWEIRKWMTLERELARVMRPAVYETVGKARLQQPDLDADKIVEAVRRRTANDVYPGIVRRLCEEPPREWVVREVIGVLSDYLDSLNNVLKDERPWLLGQDFSLADLAVAPRLVVLPIIGAELDPQICPHLASYLKRFESRPSWDASGDTSSYFDFADFPDRG